MLNRLNENVQASERTVRPLRTYLDVQVGKHKYRISQERDPAFSAHWSLLDSGFEPTDELLAAGRTHEIQQALDELMAAVEANGEADARAMSLLDYRNYHRYDIKMRPADPASGPEISFGRSGVSLSGGENQAPFFISTHRDVGKKNNRSLGTVLPLENSIASDFRSPHRLGRLRPCRNHRASPGRLVRLPPRAICSRC